MKIECPLCGFENDKSSKFCIKCNEPLFESNLRYSKELKKVIAYWYDCIKHEDILEKDISINVRTKAVLYPFDNEPFIFNHKEEYVLINDEERLINFSDYTNSQGYEVYYGYPLLFYFDNNLNKYLVAPLFIIKTAFIKEEGDMFLRKDEQHPTCGLRAFTKLGFRTEEIAELGQQIETLFKGSILNPGTLVKKCLEVIQKETELTINEPIDPSNLTNSEKISKNMSPGLYNKSMIFAGESSVYNISLLYDLLELKEKNDLDETALSFIFENVSMNEEEDVDEKVPILPFPSNEYQIKALQNIFKNKLSVITGPPGTGKSQFISNLIINLFLEGKSVLFVSHTGEAVDVVNRKINEQFRNLMIRTGRKEFRQELKGKFNELLIDSEKVFLTTDLMEQLQSMWQTILKYRQVLWDTDKLEQQFENKYMFYHDRKLLFSEDDNLKQSFRKLFPNLERIKNIKRKLDNLKSKIENKQFSLWEKIVLFISPNNLAKKKEKLFINLKAILPPECLKILQNTSYPAEIKDWNDSGWLRLAEYLELLKCFYELEEDKQKLDTYQPRIITEQRIKKIEKDFYNLSMEYVKSLYVQKMIGKGKKVGKVNSFLNQVNSRRPNDENIDSYLFEEALDILKIWSSTLKSVRRTFPLNPGIFDYVIFDEASQVDLPSAAPALYRAKKAIIVGDPMQLTHIAGITKEIDRVLAKYYDLTEMKDIYLSKIRYCDVSLYKSAENSINYKPIFLINHYRSEDQIIALCNKTFYGGNLKIMTTHDYSKIPGNLPLGIHWLDCKGTVYKHPAGSRINQKEVEVVSGVFFDILKKISGTNLSVGVVTPYRCQRDAIYEKISSTIQPELFEKHDVKILTAHKFQGSEKDIMIFSLVLASLGNGNSDSWYNIYPQILNVALSRAKYLLYIVGDKNYCVQHSCKRGNDCILKKLVRNYNEIKNQEQMEEYSLYNKFDTRTEEYLFKKLQEIDFNFYGYKLIPKLVCKRYTLDIALVGKKLIDIECDGAQHEIIAGMPVLEDVERDEFLHKEGWEVIRFSNHKILLQTEVVIKEILENLKKKNLMHKGRVIVVQ